jgi:hypothetical protein
MGMAKGNTIKIPLNAILERNPTLAFRWLHSQIESGGLEVSMHHQALHTAAGLIDKHQRIQLLRLYTREIYDDECFDLIIGPHTKLFADWLSFQTDAYLRLRPLDRKVSPRWEQMAVLALDAGVMPEELADHCLPIHFGGQGPLSEHFLNCIPAYEALAKHCDLRLRPAGEYGLRFMRAQAQRELERERLEETYG